MTYLFAMFWAGLPLHWSPTKKLKKVENEMVKHVTNPVEIISMKTFLFLGKRQFNLYQRDVDKNVCTELIMAFSTCFTIITMDPPRPPLDLN